MPVDRPSISAVATLYRSAPYLDDFYQRLRRSLLDVSADYEIVLVHDGSPDDSLKKAVELVRADPRVAVVDLSRNFGHHRAMMIGLEQSNGERVFLIDADLETPPEILADFCRVLEEKSADAVYGVRVRRAENWLDNALASAFYWCINRLTAFKLPRDVLTVRLMTRRYVEALVAYKEREFAIFGLWALAGFEQTAYPVNKGVNGASSYDLRRRFEVALRAVTAFSERPALIVAALGCLLSLACLVAAVVLAISGPPLLAWAVWSIWSAAGLILAAVGVVGVYVGKVLIEVKQRPYATIRRVYRAADS